MNNIDTIYVINLRKRRDRIANFMESLPLGFIEKVKIVGAIDGVNHVLSNDEIKKLRNADWNVEQKRGIWGCSFSHELIWRSIIEKGQKYAFVLEDDAVFQFTECDDFIKMVKLLDIPICFLGPSNHPENINGSHDFTDLVGPKICKMKSNLGSMSYLISLEGAAALVKIIDERGHYRAVDQIINDYMKQIKKWVCSSPPLFSVANLGSDVSPYKNPH